MKTKICKTCKEQKPITDFYKSKKHKDGKLNVCNVCCQNAFKKNYNANFDHTKMKVEKRKEKFKKFPKIPKGGYKSIIQINKFQEIAFEVF